MAVGDYADLQSYNTQARAGVFEAIYQNYAEGNFASNGAINFTMRAVEGDYKRESFFPRLAAIRHRDIDSQAAVTPLAISSTQNTSVKVSKGWGPVDWQRDQFVRALLQPANDDYRVIYNMLGQAMGQDMAQEIFNTAIVAAANALVNESNAYYTAPSTGTLDTAALFGGLKLLGDKGSNIALWVMPGKMFFDLAGSQASVAAENLVNFVYYRGIPATLGKPVIVADVPGLTTNSPSDYMCVGLFRDAITIENQGSEILELETVLGNQNVQYRAQGEYDYTLGIRGFTWDENNGGANPTAAALALGTNWDLTASDIKGGPGVVIAAA